ncbi:uncharacterized protein LOC125555639 isoform X2 [Triticum urartu]|uniref:uncharacterized protein LOC125555639 isoform X2 n=1 Tax=Triticum urartu TaxID=4572 RepID=UPI002043DBBB|nr:uncharacterized protein LOC125555639 isoform X2 [Triticum urartu]
MRLGRFFNAGAKQHLGRPSWARLEMPLNPTKETKKAAASEGDRASRNPKSQSEPSGDPSAAEARIRIGAMATALRHAARRFGTRAAAEAEAEAIIERSPLHTSTRIVDSTTGRDLTPNQRKDAIFRLAQIHAQKEDLYNTIAAWQADYTAKGNVVTRKNNLLLKQLSQHVKPRPDDPRWHSSQRAVYFNDFLKFTGAVLIGKMAGDAFSHYKAKQDHDGHKGSS